MEKEKLEKEKEEVEILLSQIEEEYRKANITEETYKEMKEKYQKRLKEINKKLGIKESKGGLLSKIISKKEEKKESPYEVKTEGPVYFDPLNPPKEILEEVKPEEEKKELKIEGEKVGTEIIMEIEKFRATLDAFKEEKKVMTEQIRTINESIGELRSLIFQTDASLRELELKFGKIADQVEEIDPNKIIKRFMEIEKNIEKTNVSFEKVEKRIDELSDRVNKVFELLRTAGSLENIIEISKKIDERAKEIKDAISYIERVASKVEKTFIEMSKSLQEFSLYKSRQEELEASLKDIFKSLDAINAKMENVATTRDLEAVKTSIATLDTQIKEFEKSLPMIDAKVPETIKILRNERDDLIILLESLEEQLKQGKISLGDYEKSRSNTEKRIKEIEEKLIEEWKKVEKFLETGGIEMIPKAEEKEEEEYKELPAKKIEKKIEKEEYIELPVYHSREEKIEKAPEPIKELKVKSKEELEEEIRKFSKKE